jgi:proline iminopeptidase
VPEERRGLYPAIEPFASGHLPVSGGHHVYWEQSGNPLGKPALFLHGGPGGGTDPKHRCFFDPGAYRIVLIDQRGCGKSRPHASLEHNTTWDLVDDLERIREELEIDRWLVFGGSWGSTLGLAYAQRHAARVSELVLRGVFMFTREEMAWFYGGGTAMLFPDAWADFVAPIPAAERDDVVAAYHRRLTDPDPDVRARYARAWSRYECRVATLLEDPEIAVHCDDLDFALPFARIECHYFVHRGFLEHDRQLFDHLDRLADIPVRIVHGRYDVICPVRNAWTLHQRLPRSTLVVVPDAGHSAFEPGIVAALVEATDAFRR